MRAWHRGDKAGMRSKRGAATQLPHRTSSSEGERRGDSRYIGEKKTGQPVNLVSEF